MLYVSFVQQQLESRKIITNDALTLIGNKSNLVSVAYWDVTMTQFFAHTQEATEWGENSAKWNKK